MDCKIKICKNEFDFYTVNSCDTKFSVGSMYTRYSTDSFKKAIHWLEENKKKYQALYLEGFFLR